MLAGEYRRPRSENMNTGHRRCGGLLIYYLRTKEADRSWVNCWRVDTRKYVSIATPIEQGSLYIFDFA